MPQGAISYSVDPPRAPRITKTRRKPREPLRPPLDGSNARRLIPRDLIAEPEAYFRSFYTYAQQGAPPERSPQATPEPLR